MVSPAPGPEGPSNGRQSAITAHASVVHKPEIATLDSEESNTTPRDTCAPARHPHLIHPDPERPRSQRQRCDLTKADGATCLTSGLRETLQRDSDSRRRTGGLRCEQRCRSSPPKSPGTNSPSSAPKNPEQDPRPVRNRPHLSTEVRARLQAPKSTETREIRWGAAAETALGTAPPKEHGEKRRSPRRGRRPASSQP